MGVVGMFLLPSFISLLSPLGGADIDLNTVSRAVRPKTTNQNVASLTIFLTTQYAMLENVKQKLHDVRENKAIIFACKNQSK